MSEKRFRITTLPKSNAVAFDEQQKKYYIGIDFEDLLNDQQATLTEYEEFCHNLCIFIIGKGLVDEFREKYGKEYKIITKWKGCV